MRSVNGAVDIGSPKVDGAEVKFEILRHYRGKKVIVFKKKRRKRYTKKIGHRQEHTTVVAREI